LLKKEDNTSNKVSVIIPAYNSEGTIENTLLSVISQTIEGIEIIVVINGTTDSTSEIAERVLSNQKRHQWRIIHEKVGNVGKARNIGIENAEGKYLFFLDSDDFIDHNALAELYKTAEKENADIAFCGFRKTNEQKKILFEYDDLFDYYDTSKNGLVVLDDFLKGKTWIWIATVLFKKQLVTDFELRFSEKYSSGEDQCFIMYNLFYARIVCSCNKVLSSYFSHAQGLSSSKKVFESIQGFEEFIDFVKGQENLENNGLVNNILNTIINYKMPYLLTRNLYRYAKKHSYYEFSDLLKTTEELMNKYPLIIKPKNKHSKFGIIGHFLLLRFPSVFYLFARLYKG